jgi:hypothetical protein
MTIGMISPSLASLPHHRLISPEALVLGRVLAVVCMAQRLQVAELMPAASGQWYAMVNIGSQCAAQLTVRIDCEILSAYLCPLMIVPTCCRACPGVYWLAHVGVLLTIAGMGSVWTHLISTRMRRFAWHGVLGTTIEPNILSQAHRHEPCQILTHELGVNDV